MIQRSLIPWRGCHLLIVLLLSSIPAIVSSQRETGAFSFPLKDQNQRHVDDNCKHCNHALSTTASTFNRREWIGSFVGCGVFGVSITIFDVAFPQAVAAACLPGDLSPDCIGVYKEYKILPYASTPEALKKVAPDLRYVPPMPTPDSKSQAMEILQTQRLAADDILNVIGAGRLEEAGIKVLNLLPKLSSSGKVVLDEIISRNRSASSTPSVIESLRQTKLQEQLDITIGLWGECDVMIGQGLRGQLGVSAVAQIQILQQVKEAMAALDDFLVAATKAEAGVR